VGLTSVTRGHDQVVELVSPTINVLLLLQARIVAWRLKILRHAEEEPRHVAQTCRYYGMDRLPVNQKHQPHRKRWKRYEKVKPGHRLQMDVKFLERIPGTGKRLYKFTAIDDCTRIRVLKVYDRCNQRTAIRFLNEVRIRLPFRIQVLQTDNGAEFQSNFHWHAESLDIRHVYIRPASPHLNGKVERSHRIDVSQGS
jgi:transposase InsO family protein